jgi:hypothetical protein
LKCGDPTVSAKILYNETGFFNLGNCKVQRDDDDDDDDDGTSHFTSEIRTIEWTG